MATIYGLRRINEQTYFYVGSTRFSADHRFKAHMSDVRLGKHTNRHFVNTVKQTGESNITVDVLQDVDESKRYDAERDWIERLLREGHRLVNRAYVDFDPYGFSGGARAVVYTEMTPERFQMAYECAHSPAPVAKDPSMQKISDGLHDVLRVMVDDMIRRFPEQVAADFGFQVKQENAR